MKIAELFISLGVKGHDSTNNALKGVKTGLGEAKSMAFETKAMIAAVVYGLERMMSASGRTGTGLKNFAANTKLSTKELQQYQYAARKVGATNEEVESSFSTLQAKMADHQTGRGTIGGFSEVARLTGGINQQQMKEFQDSPAKLIQRLQQYAKAERDAGLRNQQLATFGLTQGMITAINSSVFSHSNLKKAPTLSDRQIGRLDQVRNSWAEIGDMIQMAFAQLTAEKGGNIVKKISTITKEMIELVKQMVVFAEKTESFERFANILTGIANTVKLVNEVMAMARGESPKKGDLLYNDGYIAPNQQAAQAGTYTAGIKTFIKGFIGNTTAYPKVSPEMDSSKIPVPAVNTTTIIQHNNIKGKTAPKDIAKETSKAVNHAYKNNQAARRVN